MNELLKALADNDREREASPAVEMRLRAAFRRQHRRRIWPYLAIAAAVVAGVLLIPRPKPAQTMEIAVFTPPVAVVPTPKLRAASVPRQPREIVTQFYPLMEGTPFERGELVRVKVPASTMRSVGLPVSEDHLDDLIQADVLIGDEGLARAIRFVQTDLN